MYKRILLLFVVTVLFFGFIFLWKAAGLQKTNALMAKMPSTVVSTTRVKAESWESFLSSVGSLTASKGVSVTNEVAGQVSKIVFVSGQKIDKGQLLLQLDDSVDQAEFRGLRAERNLAKLQLKRDKKLLKERSVSRAAFDESQTKLENMTAQVEAKKALIDKKQIRAPFSGWLGIRQINLGEYLAPGATIVSLQSLNPIYADYSLPERYIDKIQVGQTVQIEVQGYRNVLFEGQISAIEPAIDTATRSLKLRATLGNADARLRPGMFAQIKTLLPARDKILTVPEIAITYAPYGDSVFVIQEGKGKITVQLSAVKTGEVRNGRIEVLDGLLENQQIVTAGQVKLRNGMPVTIDNRIVLGTGGIAP